MKISSVTKLSYLLLALTILLACKKENLPNISCNEKSNTIDVVRKLLPGSYYWAYTKGYYLGGYTDIATPATTGKNHKYVYSKNGKRSYYQNNVLKSIDTYTIDYEFKITAYPSDSATIVIIFDSTGQRKSFFRPHLCTDSALFNNPYTSVDYQTYFKRN